MPAEWAPHAACFTAYPHLAEEWGPDLDPARNEVAELCRAIADIDPVSGQARGEAVELLVAGEACEAEARERLLDLPVRYRRATYGDIWMRDIAPVFRTAAGGDEEALVFGFNGWGGRYRMPGDAGLAERLARDLGTAVRRVDVIGEGGALEVDGEGTCLTTRDCLLNANRNPDRDERELSDMLRDALGVERVVWLDAALANDHTDGHIDTLARFVAPGVVVCMEPVADDPNSDVLTSLADQLGRVRDARGRRLEVHRVPSPGRVTDRAGRVMPASYCNFYIANRTVVVPTYGSAHDDEAVARIADLFRDRRTVGLSARAILTGGGAFHCITQQRPAGAGEAQPS